MGRLTKITQLNEVRIQYGYLAQSITKDISRSDHFKKSFTRFFFKFTDDLLGQNNLQITDRSGFELLLEASLMVPDDASGLPDYLAGFRAIKDSEDFEIYKDVFNNAYVYAISVCYKNQIKLNYMRAKNSTNLSAGQEMEHMIMGTVNGYSIFKNSKFATKHSDSDYLMYMKNEHPGFFQYVKSTHRFQYKSILIVAGYLINPDLDI